MAAAAATAADIPLAFDDPDIRNALEESAPSFQMPTLNDYLEARARFFRDDIPERFDAAIIPGAEKAAPLATAGAAPEDKHSFTGLNFSAGDHKRVEAYAFHGREWTFADMAAGVRESRSASGDGAFENNFLRAEAGGAFSDQAGTTVGFAGNYENTYNRLRILPPARIYDGEGNFSTSGEGSGFFRSNLWGRAKFATAVTGSFTDGEYAQTPAGANAIAVEADYDFFWWGNKQVRGDIDLTQENYRAREEQRGYFVGRTDLESDFPIADRLYLSIGFAGSAYKKSAATSYRIYPLGRLRYRIGGGWGCFVAYMPGFRFPSFRELYLHRDYMIPGPFRPAEDRYSAVKSGISFDLQDIVRFTGSIYENRYRQTFGARDMAFGQAEYYDPGRTRTRGFEVSYRLRLHPFENYGRILRINTYLYDTPWLHYTYNPEYSARGGLTFNFRGGHNVTADILYIGERYALPDAAEPLTAAWVPGLSTFIAIVPGMGLTAAAENITAARYYDEGGVLAPGRTIRGGCDFQF